MRIQSGLSGKDGGCSLNYASDTKEAAFIASLAAAIPNMQQIASSTGHPMSEDLTDCDSDHPVMNALRTHRDWLVQELGESPDNPTVPTIPEMINLKSSTKLQKILSDRLSGHRRKSFSAISPS